MDEQTTFLDALVATIKRASNYNRNDQVPPTVVLWPDKDRQWEGLLPLLREYLPLLTLGPYKPNEWTGPAYWLRCVIARTLPEYLLPVDVVPIVYLPGVSKQEIRAVEDTPRMLQPLAELQYRGTLWTHKNGRDWTISAFMQSHDGGLGIEIGTDSTTREALQRALLKLVDEPIARLKKEAPLRAAFFDMLLNPDEVRNLLLWLNDPGGYPKRCRPGEWASFCDLCQRKYEFHPEKDGITTAVALLGRHQEAWGLVWDRFKEAPHSYPHLPERLRNARPEQPFAGDLSEVWPQDNEYAESKLRECINNLRHLLPQEIRTGIKDLEKEHATRRSWVWAHLGQSSLALALQYLTILSDETERVLNSTTVKGICIAYTEWGWKVDAAVIDSLAAVEQPEDVAVVKAIVAALYRPWLEEAALAMQKAVYSGDPLQTYCVEPLSEVGDGTCILFCDGLRYDVGQRLVSALKTLSLVCNVDFHLVPLPSITPTAKPAISPVAKMLSGRTSPGFEPMIVANGTKVTAEGLRKLLVQAGYQVLRGEDLGDPSGRAWAEMGTIDSYGHQNGWRLAHHLKEEIHALQRRIEALLALGWKQVVVVTDHGWLLLPDTLPKAELPEHLTYTRKGRCAQLKEASYAAQETLPWYWNHDVRIALAPNICCYEAGKEYEHGGLSPQECIVPLIMVSRQDDTKFRSIIIKDITWRGLRCTMRIAGAIPGMLVDIRTKSGDPSTTLARVPKVLSADDIVSLLIQDEDRIGAIAQIVVLDKDGIVCKQILTTIGG